MAPGGDAPWDVDGAEGIGRVAAARSGMRDGGSNEAGEDGWGA